MDDCILRSRLTALLDNLEVVNANLHIKQWQPAEPKYTRAELLEKALWAGMESTIKLEIERQQRKLRTAIQDRSTVTADTWKHYSHVLTESRTLLREGLEIIGTLAIRNKGLDAKILHVADELIRDCLTLSIGTLDYYLTVHGLDETFMASKAYIIHMRFPEWTIWDLPLIAHELGRVSIAILSGKEKAEDNEELRFLTAFISEQERFLIDKFRNSTSEAKPSEVEQWHKWAASRVRKLAADAFATYTMGPAYACSAIYLRLNPTLKPSGDTPSDAERARVVLNMLEWMNSRASPTNQPYAWVIDRLCKAWQSVLQQSNENCELSASEEEYIRVFTHSFAENVCPQRLTRRAIYPSESWNNVSTWSTHWRSQQKDGIQFTIPEATEAKIHDVKIRDVLNAVWSYRLEAEDFSEFVRNDLNRVGKELCGSIIAALPDSGRIPSMTVPKVPTRQ
jgi:hypothetical protein